MAVLADFFLGDDEIARQYDDDQSCATEKAEHKNLTVLEMSTLWCALSGTEWDESILDRFRQVHAAGERVTVECPTEFLQLLTESEDRLDDVAEQWAATEEMACEPTIAREIIDSLLDLAWKATGSGQHMYLWNCP